MGYTELKNKQVKCRKPHRCIWCGEELKVGDTALYRAGIFDGDFQSDHWHPECWDAMLECDWYDCDGEFEPYAFQRGMTMHESEDFYAMETGKEARG